MHRLLMIVAICGLALSGCAPGRFAGSTASFSSSVDKLADAVDTTVVTLRRAEIEKRNQEFARNRVRPVLATVCSETRVKNGPDGERRPGCTLVARASDTPPVDPVWQQLGEGYRMIRALSDYAKANVEVTSAESREEIDEATDKAATALEAILTFAGQAPTAGVLGTGMRLGGYAIGEFHDWRRYRQLRRNVEEGQAVLGRVTLPLTNVLVALDSAVQGNLQSSGNFLSERIDPRRPDYDDRLRRLSEFAAAKEAMQRTDPEETIKAILRAHAELAAAIRETRGQTIAMLDALAKLASRVDALKAALAAFNTGT